MAIVMDVVVVVEVPILIGITIGSSHPRSSRKIYFSSHASRGTQRTGCKLMIQAPTQLPPASGRSRRTSDVQDEPGARSSVQDATDAHTFL